VRDETSSRRDLGSFLRSRRERIAPSEVGLPTSRRRRTAGLRREEVAVLAGLSPTWYTYLEQGRDIRPSTEVLDSLAGVLQLNEDERGYLHLLAYGQRPPLKGLPSQPHGEELLWELIRSFDSRYPHYAANRHADVLAWNDAATEWYTDFAKLADQYRNTVWWALREPEAHERLVNWEEDPRDMVGRLRSASANGPDDGRLANLISELRDVSPEFKEWWPNYQINNQAPAIRWLRHPTHGVQAMRLVVLFPVGTPGIGIALHLPITDGPAD
jgi:transcriptional regulator with XRE-family HTH domain